MGYRNDGGPSRPHDQDPDDGPDDKSDDGFDFFGEGDGKAEEDAEEKPKAAVEVLNDIDKLNNGDDDFNWDEL